MLTPFLTVTHVQTSGRNWSTSVKAFKSIDNFSDVHSFIVGSELMRLVFTSQIIKIIKQQRSLSCEASNSFPGIDWWDSWTDHLCVYMGGEGLIRTGSPVPGSESQQQTASLQQNKLFPLNPSWLGLKCPLATEKTGQRAEQESVAALIRMKGCRDKLGSLGFYRDPATSSLRIQFKTAS